MKKRKMLDSTIVKVSNFALGCHILCNLSFLVKALLLTVVSLLFVLSVWHSGQVEAVSWVREQWPGNPVQKVDQWKAIYRTQTDQDWPDNIHVHCDCDGLPPDVTTGQFDGVSGATV